MVGLFHWVVKEHDEEDERRIRLAMGAEQDGWRTAHMPPMAGGTVRGKNGGVYEAAGGGSTFQPPVGARHGGGGW